MEFTIRPAELSDREKIRPLQKEIADLHHDGRPDLFRTEARYYTDESFSEKLKNPDCFVYIAESSGEVIGYVFAVIMKYRGHPTYIEYDSFYIDDICVLEKFRCNGVGEALFRHCAEIAAAFYERMGMHEMMKRMELKL